MNDLISRQAAIDAINSHFGFNIEEEYGSAVQEIINGLPSAQPEPCEDTISRQAAIDALDVGAEVLRRVLDDADIVCAEREKYKWGLGLIESCISDIKELSSAQPEVLACGEGELIAQPKIIRCKECVYADENYHCDYMTTWNDGDCFCCYGKRRNDEQ